MGNIRHFEWPGLLPLGTQPVEEWRTLRAADRYGDGNLSASNLAPLMEV